MKLSTLMFIYALLKDEERSLKKLLRECAEKSPDPSVESGFYDLASQVREQTCARLQEVDSAIADLMGVNWRNG